MDIKKIIFNLLPKKTQKMRETYVKGKIDSGADEGAFLYDRNLIKKLKVTSYSQFGQDAFVFYMVFGGRKEGVFLDIGGNDPIEINNTYLLEKEGWQGIAFEPQKFLADKWKEYRKTPCYNIAIGNMETEVTFTEMNAHQLSGIGIKGDPKSSSYKVQQRKLSAFLSEKNISHIDVAFIDVEGYEMQVLEGIDFVTTDITCICIENNRNSDILPDMELRNFLISKGYVLIGRLTIDDVFVKKEYFDEKD